MFAKVTAAVLTGIDVRLIQVETDVSNGLPYFELVGYLSAEVREARERVKAAIRNSGYRLDPKRILVNLSPADIRKSGTGFDLAIALSILTAYNLIPSNAFEDVVVMGELSLDGRVKDINGTLPICLEGLKKGFKKCIVPSGNYSEALASGMEVLGVNTLYEIAEHLNGHESMTQKTIEDIKTTRTEPDWEVDFSEIRGQMQLKRCMEIAAAGMHHILMIGPPGSGKSMAARRLATILPEMTFEESVQVTGICSIAGLLGQRRGLVSRRPFRNPHHSITEGAMTGGGIIPKPGEISLAHRGILFLDEFTEFNPRVIEALREPLEEGKISISRQHASCQFPAEFMLVAAMNPCKCGYYPDMKKCNCSPLQIRRYIGRISRPVMDRIDMTIEVKPVSAQQLQKSTGEEEKSETIRKRVEKARLIQKERYQGTDYDYNSQIRSRDIAKYCCLGDEEKKLMESLYEAYELTTRSYHKILKVARTIADLDESHDICCSHISEAFFYKALDQKYWGGNTYDRQ